jgi:uncharacterized membrane protein YqjE
MSRLMRHSRYVSSVILYALAVITLASIYGQDILLFVMLGLTALAIGYTYFLFRSSLLYFTCLAGASIALEAILVVAAGTEGFELPWVVLGFGLLAILMGNHSIRTLGLMGRALKEVGDEEKMFHSVALRGFLRIVYFVGLVMLVSLIVLVVSLNASIGRLTIPMAALCILIVLAALTLLATTRHRTA